MRRRNSLRYLEPLPPDTRTRAFFTRTTEKALVLIWEMKLADWDILGPIKRFVRKILNWLYSGVKRVIEWVRSGIQRAISWGVRTIRRGLDWVYTRIRG